MGIFIVVQDTARTNAERLRAELAELEKGNEMVVQLVKESGDNADVKGTRG